MSEVLALKYRPKNFQNLVGQETIAQTLSLALKTNRLGHAYLFSGLRGSGKTSTARIFAKALLCENADSSGEFFLPCENCIHCQQANENSHLDIIEMDAASNRKIDDIRELIEQTKYKPNFAKYKVFIIDEVHMLTREAFNALLKTLEEPPNYIKFILATTDPLKLPPTILSRTQHFRFKNIGQKYIISHLAYILNNENKQFEPEALSMIARSSHGSLRDSLTLTDQAIIYTNGNLQAQKVAQMLGLLDSKKLDIIFDFIFKGDKKQLIEFVSELEEYEAEVIIDELISFIKEKFYANDPRFSMLLCERFFKILSEAKSLMGFNADSGFILSLVFFKFLEARKIKNIEDLIKEFEAMPATAPNFTQMQQASAIAPEILHENVLSPKKDQFTVLCEKLNDRNYELGTCFEKNVKFIKFEDNILSLQSSASGEDQVLLRTSSGIILKFILEIYGKDTKIDMQQAQEQSQKSLENEIVKEEINKEEQVCEVKSEESKENIISNILNNPTAQKIKQTFEINSIYIEQN